MAIGDLRHVGVFQKPGGQIPDGEGGYIDGWIDLTPAPWPVQITPATARDLERSAASTVVATATHLIVTRWRSDLDTSARMTFEGRIFSITGIQNVDERDQWLRLTAEEQLGQ